MHTKKIFKMGPKRSGYAVFFIWASLVVILNAKSISAGQIIGQLSDPANTSIPGCIDIISARVEKSDANLTFILTTRGPIPSSIPDPCSITYLWLVDADNDPQTGQNPDAQIGSEFNVRAVVRTALEGWVDVTGSWPPGGGQADVTVDANQIQITIKMSQIDSPDLFHFRCDAGTWDGIATGNSNGFTPESAETWVSNYAVLYSRDIRLYGIDQNSIILRCDSNYPFDPDKASVAVHKTWNNQGDTSPQFNSVQEILPLEDDSDHEFFIQSLGSADFLHLRTLTYFDVINGLTGTFGESHAKTTFSTTFSLVSKSGRTGPVQHGLFNLNISHDYHLRGWSETDQTEAATYGQIVITDITDFNNIEQKFLWPSGRNAFMDKLSSAKNDNIDLADKGFQFDRVYVIDLALLDWARLMSPTANALASSDSSLTVSIDTALAPDFDKNRIVNMLDLAVFAADWLKEK